MNLYTQAMAEKATTNKKPISYTMKNRNIANICNWSMIRDLNDPKTNNILRETFVSILELSLPEGKIYNPGYLDDAYHQFLETGNMKYRAKDDKKVLEMIREMNIRMRG